MKPTIKEVEEYMASLNIPLEQGLNGTTKYDVISKPKHYMLFDSSDVMVISVKHEGIEVRDVIAKLVEKLGPPVEGMFIADYVQLMQYLMRFMDKNGVEDLKKARWYLDKMISSY